MTRKAAENSIELARKLYGEGGSPRYTPKYNEYGTLQGTSWEDRANIIKDKYDAFMGHPVVQAFGEEPLEMTKAVAEDAWEGAKQLPGMAADAAKWAYENPARASEKAVEHGIQFVNKPIVAGPAAFFWGPFGIFNPDTVQAAELNPESAAVEHSRQQIMNQEAQMMRDYNYAGGYCGGGEVREAHGNGKKVVGPLAAAAESAMTKAAEKVLAEKAAKAAEYIPHNDPRRAANLLAYRGNTPQEILDQRWYHGTDKDFPSFNADAPIFLTPSPRFANRFSVENVPTGELVEGAGVNPNVMPLIPRAENPFDFENRKHAKALETYLKPEMKNDAYLRYQFDSLKQGDWQEIESKKIQDAIKALGHDSFYVDEYGTKNLAVYSPNQVKSDIGNAGTFDFDTPRLTEAKGGKAR